MEWGLYSAVAQGDVVVTIETKLSWREGESLFNRHDPEAYKVTTTYKEPSVSHFLGPPIFLGPPLGATCPALLYRLQLMV